MQMPRGDRASEAVQLQGKHSYVAWTVNKKSKAYKQEYIQFILLNKVTLGQSAQPDTLSC